MHMNMQIDLFLTTEITKFHRESVIAPLSHHYQPCNEPHDGE